MPYYEFIWNDEIVDHLAEHDVSPEQLKTLSHIRKAQISATRPVPRALLGKRMMDDT